MRIVLLLAVALLLAACGGGSGSRTNQNNGAVPPVADAPGGDAAGRVTLALSAARDGELWRVNLKAPQATDLYQVGGTLAFDGGKYEVESIEAGGGLGQPATSYFIGQETAPGRVDFAYTRRFFGPGASGSVWLVSLRVRPTGQFRLSDFRLDEQARLLARDSKKQSLTVTVGGDA
jgi:hypothetical protein